MGTKQSTAPLSVPCEVRALATRREGGHVVDVPGPRWFRLTTRIDRRALTLRRPLPLEPGARVRATLALPAPDPDSPFAMVQLPGTLDVLDTPQGPRNVIIQFGSLDDDTRARIEAYLLERLGQAA